MWFHSPFWGVQPHDCWTWLENQSTYQRPLLSLLCAHLCKCIIIWTHNFFNPKYFQLSKKLKMKHQKWQKRKFGEGFGKQDIHTKNDKILPISHPSMPLQTSEFIASRWGPKTRRMFASAEVIGIHQQPLSFNVRRQMMSDVFRIICTKLWFTNYISSKCCCCYWIGCKNCQPFTEVLPILHLSCSVASVGKMMINWLHKP